MEQNVSSKPNHPYQAMSPIDWIYDIISLILSQFDIITDVIVTYQYYHSPSKSVNTIYFGISLAILILSHLVLAGALTKSFVRYRATTAKTVLWICIFIILSPFFTLIFWFDHIGLITSLQARFDLLQFPRFPPKKPKRKTHKSRTFSTNNNDWDINPKDILNNENSNSNYNYNYNVICDELDIPTNDELSNRVNNCNNDYLGQWLRDKFESHLGMVFESLLLSIPLTILQLIFVILYYNDNSDSINNSNDRDRGNADVDIDAYHWSIASLMISLLSLSLKSLLFSYSIDYKMFVYNFIMFACDFFGAFAVLASVLIELPNDNQYSNSLFGTILDALGTSWLYCVLLVSFPLSLMTTLFLLFSGESLKDGIERLYDRLDGPIIVRMFLFVIGFVGLVLLILIIPLTFTICLEMTTFGFAALLSTLYFTFLRNGEIFYLKYIIPWINQDLVDDNYHGHNVYDNWKFRMCIVNYIRLWNPHGLCNLNQTFEQHLCSKCLHLDKCKESMSILQRANILENCVTFTVDTKSKTTSAKIHNFDKYKHQFSRYNINNVGNLDTRLKKSKVETDIDNDDQAQISIPKMETVNSDSNINININTNLDETMVVENKDEGHYYSLKDSDQKNDDYDDDDNDTISDEKKEDLGDDDEKNHEQQLQLQQNNWNDTIDNDGWKISLTWHKYRVFARSLAKRTLLNQFLHYYERLLLNTHNCICEKRFDLLEMNYFYSKEFSNVSNCIVVGFWDDVKYLFIATFENGFNRLFGNGMFSIDVGDYMYDIIEPNESEIKINYAENQDKFDKSLIKFGNKYLVWNKCDLPHTIAYDYSRNECGDVFHFGFVLNPIPGLLSRVLWYYYRNPMKKQQKQLENIDNPVLFAQRSVWNTRYTDKSGIDQADGDRNDINIINRLKEFRIQFFRWYFWLCVVLFCVHKIGAMLYCLLYLIFDIICLINGININIFQFGLLTTYFCLLIVVFYSIHYQYIFYRTLFYLIPKNMRVLKEDRQEQHKINHRISLFAINMIYNRLINRMNVWPVICDKFGKEIGQIVLSFLADSTQIIEDALSLCHEANVQFENAQKQDL